MSTVFSRFQKQNDESDQSISEEENLDDDWSGNWTHIGVGVGKTAGMQVLSQLDLLKEPLELASATREISPSFLTQTNFSNEDEIEFPAFDRSDELDQLPDEASKCISDVGINLFSNSIHDSITDEESISDDDRVGYAASLSVLDEGEVASNEATRKAARTIYSSDKPGCSSSSRKVDERGKDYKGLQVKHKDSLLSSSKYTTEDSLLYFKDKNYISKLSNAQCADHPNSATDKESNNSMVNLLEVYDEKLKQSEGHGMQNNAIVYQRSVAEFIDGFQEKSDFPPSRLNKHSRIKGRNRPIAHKRSKSSSCGREMDCENETEASDIGQSSDDELLQDGPQNLKSSKPGKTMADQLQQTFGVISTSDLPNRTLSKQSGGLHEKLQCIMQIEKEIEMIFFKTLNPSSVGDNQFMDVKILSRSLEAKLTVCQCALTGKKENSETVDGCGMGNSGRALTILFSPKICTDIELEVGNLIRIHFPWKEVQLKGNAEVILLSTFFSLIYT